LIGEVAEACHDGSVNRHPTTRTWAFPPPREDLPGIRRVNLRELVARPGRFEHHLMVVGEVGPAQIEIVTASEPLFFAHANISDEYAMALPTGDAMLDGFPLRTFLADPSDGELTGRIRHAVGQMVLHPHGALHWPGKLRPPYEPPAFPGPRRCGLSLVFCASTPTLPEERPLEVSAGLDDNTKAYRGSPPFHLVDVMAAQQSAWLGQVGTTRMELLVRPARVTGPGYLVALEASDDGDWFPCDLAHLESGAEADGVSRALLFTGESVAPPPESWDQVPTPPMAPFEDAERQPPPTSVHGIAAEEIDDATVRITVSGHAASIPRYWLGRMLFRIALHDYALGYLETYEGFCYDDRDGYLLGLRTAAGHATVKLTRDEVKDAVEHLYRSVPPPGYTESLS
jgi:hypothetical protein